MSHDDKLNVPYSLSIKSFIQSMKYKTFIKIASMSYLHTYFAKVFHSFHFTLSDLATFGCRSER